MTEKNYRMINLNLRDDVRAVAMRSMNEAAEEVRQTQTYDKDEIVAIGVVSRWNVAASQFQFTEWGCSCNQYR